MQGQLDIGVSKAICIHGRKVAALMNCVLTKWVLVRISVSPKGGTRVLLLHFLAYVIGH